MALLKSFLRLNIFVKVPDFYIKDPGTQAADPRHRIAEDKGSGTPPGGLPSTRGKETFIAFYKINRNNICMHIFSGKESNSTERGPSAQEKGEQPDISKTSRTNTPIKAYFILHTFSPPH